MDIITAIAAAISENVGWD